MFNPYLVLLFPASRSPKLPAFSSKSSVYSLRNLTVLFLLIYSSLYRFQGSSLSFLSGFCCCSRDNVDYYSNFVQICQAFLASLYGNNTSLCFFVILKSNRRTLRFHISVIVILFPNIQFSTHPFVHIEFSTENRKKVLDKKPPRDYNHPNNRKSTWIKPTIKSSNTANETSREPQAVGLRRCCPREWTEEGGRKFLREISSSRRELRPLSRGVHVLCIDDTFGWQ